ncbi:MAG: LytTR family DNA-binding domain-containing protein [Bacteroidetes bacterium]|nr:LytTR family DNA-binding domain-containing protein [Bacteroidota bacterium]
MLQKQLRAIIVDDERVSINILDNLISKHVPEVSVIGKAGSADEALKIILLNKPDIVFLDIDMPDKSGFDLAKEMRLHKLTTIIVFVTSHNEFAIEAFRYSAFDYLVKPVNVLDLKACIQRLNESDSSHHFNSSLEQVMQYLSHKKIIFRTLTGSIHINPEHIIYCQAEGNYTELVLIDDEQQMVSMRLGEVENRLSYNNFRRISRSVLINEDYLHRINRKEKKCILKSSTREYELQIKGPFKRLLH